MRKIFFVLLCLLNICANSQEMKVIDLNNNWVFSEHKKESWLPATVPGTVHTDLIANKKIEDPYYRLNELNIQWIDKKEWEYKTTFTLDETTLSQEHIELIFDGLDTYADVYLNDKHILKADNMFLQWEVNAKSHLKKENVLRIVFKSPTLEALKKLEKYGIDLPADNDQSERGEMNDKKVSPFVRKAPYHYGWDWGPRLVTSGIWRPVKLIAYNTTRIQDFTIYNKEITKENAVFNTQTSFAIAKKGIITTKIFVNEREVKTCEHNVSKGFNEIKDTFNIESPKLWYPNGYGEHPLYNIKVQLLKNDVVVDEKELKYGIRTVKLVQTPDKEGDGKSMYFEVNGIPVFAKGANYIPNDMFLPRVTNQTYQHILNTAKESNMNMLRVWGGGIYENDYFYSLCDSLGIMVWQDFMFACSMYPGNKDFLESVKDEAEYNVQRLCNHPSIVLWCGNNEIESAWGGEKPENEGWKWKKRFSDKHQKEIWEAYTKIFHKILPEAVADNTDNAIYWNSSPTAGEGNIATNETKTGDMHYWGVWHGLHPFTDFNKYIGRFVSEYGFQSFPEFNSVKKYTDTSDYNIESKVMTSHQRSGIGNLRIKQYMEQHYQVPTDFEQFLYLGQVLQAHAIKSAIYAHRKAMPYCMGSLYWQINDCWPVASWSSMDYYGKWKVLQYCVKDAFKKTIIVPTIGENIDIQIVSDSTQTFDANLSVKIIDFKGKKLYEKTNTVTIPALSSNQYYSIKLDTSFNDSIRKNCVLVSELRHKNGTLIYKDFSTFNEAKNLNLQKSNIKMKFIEEDGKYILGIYSKEYVKDVFISIDADYRLNNGLFDILPHDWIKLEFTKDEYHKIKDKIKIYSYN